MEILQKLKKYFEENTEEQILKDWEETKKDDCVNAPTVEQFLLYDVRPTFFCEDETERQDKRCENECNYCKNHRN